MRPRPKIANLHYGAVFIARSLWGSHGAPAARLGTNRKYPFCSILRGVISRRFLFQRAIKPFVSL
jgi:hypothetical protein